MTPREGLMEIAARCAFIAQQAALKVHIPPDKQDVVFRAAPADAAAEFRQTGAIVLDGVLGILDKLIAQWDTPVTAENHTATLKRIETLMGMADDPLASLELRLLAGNCERYEIRRSAWEQGRDESADAARCAGCKDRIRALPFPSNNQPSPEAPVVAGERDTAR